MTFNATPGLRVFILLLGLGWCGCVTPTEFSVQQQAQLDQIQIGKTTRNDVREQFGEPTAGHVSFANARVKESWAYAYARVGANPARYLPLFGALAVAGPEDVESLSFAVNFSEQGIVQGFTQRKLARYIIELARPGSAERVIPYGGRNLNARHSFGSP